MPEGASIPLPSRQAAVEAALGYQFRDPSLLQRALAHRSACEEHLERLEFLGDAVLGVAISEQLFRLLPEASEGQLSRIRASLVRRESLIAIARRWRIAPYLRVGSGERNAAGGIRAESILADAVEALIGAVFIDGGWEAAKPLVLHNWQPLLATIDGGADGRDAKTRLQELTQGQGWGLPEYRMEDRGAKGTPRFHATCLVRGTAYGRGEADRKKEAERLAAEQTWTLLNNS